MIQESNLVEIIAQKTGMSKKDVKKYVDRIFKLIRENISEEELVKVNRFGTFKVKKVATKTQIDVTTGKPGIVPEHNLVTFRPLFAVNNKGESLFIEEDEDFEQFDKLVVESEDAEDVTSSVENDIAGKLVFQYDGVNFNEAQISEVLSIKFGLDKEQVENTVRQLKETMIENGRTLCVVIENNDELNFELR